LSELSRCCPCRGDTPRIRRSLREAKGLVWRVIRVTKPAFVLPMAQATA